MLMPILNYTVQVALRLYNSRWFLTRSKDAEDRGLRKELLRKFRKIDREIPTEHREKEMLVMADFLLGLEIDGCIVECGCYMGGGAAKLSLVGAATGRHIYVCDSFQGLPNVNKGDGAYSDAHTGLACGFEKGGYCASRSRVEENIRRYGNLSACKLVPGFFAASLPRLVLEEKIRPCFIFCDADLISSTRDVLRNLWPQLVPGGRFYTHEANLYEFVEGIMQGKFWLEDLGQSPPVLFGAGHGCGFGAGGIGYIRKPLSDNSMCPKSNAAHIKGRVGAASEG
jgi:O-methyltransferase